MTSYWNEVVHHTDTASIWMAHPAVRDTINRRVTGDPNRWPLGRLKQWLAARAPVRDAVSIGCGVGSLERSLIDEHILETVVGVDASENAIAEARRAAPPSCTYRVADARSFLAEHTSAFDAVFFHQSLHHFDRLDELMLLVRRSLRAGGFIYLDEYIGPSRDEWNALKLIAPNLAYYSVPAATRRPRVVRAPINREDPTEAIASSGIVRALQRHFTIVDRRDYGGNILAVVYPNLRRPDEGAPRAAFDKGVRRLIAFEDRLLALGARSFYATIIAT